MIFILFYFILKWQWFGQFKKERKFHHFEGGKKKPVSSKFCLDHELRNEIFSL